MSFIKDASFACARAGQKHLQLKTTIALILGAAISFATSCTADSETEDHLIPADSLFQKYRDFLASKLGQSPFNCGRVFVEPAFEGESSVSVYCVSGNGVGRKCRIAYTQASDNLWQRTNALQNERASRVKIRRIDADISATSAISVRNAFARILKMTRPHVAREGEMRTLTTDATQI